MRREAKLTLAVLLVLSSAQAQNASYRDLSPEHWAAAAVEALTKAGVLNGFPDGTFRGDDPATRYQMALALYRLYGALTSGLAQAQSPDLAEALQGAAKAGQAAALLGNALPPEVKDLALRMTELAGKIGALEEGLARTMGAVDSLNAFKDALVALEGSQNGELMELREQLELVKRLLAETVTREDYLKGMQRLADATAEIAREVARLKEAQQKTEARVKELEAFAAPRQGDLSLRGVEAQGQLSTEPLPGPAREPAQGAALGLTAAWKEHVLRGTAGLREGLPRFQVEWQAEDRLGGTFTPEGSTLQYATGGLDVRGWNVAQALGAQVRLHTGGLTVLAEGQKKDPSAREAVYRTLEAPIPQTSGVRLEGRLEGAGPLNLALTYGATGAGQWAKGTLGVQLLPPLALEAFYASPLGSGTDLPGLDQYERWAREYGLGIRIGEGEDQARLVYRFLPEGSGPGAEVSMKGNGASLTLAGQYVRGQSPWYKVLGNARLEAPDLPVAGTLTFGLARSLASYQAFLEALVQGRLGPWNLGLGYGEFAAQNGFGWALTVVPDLNTPLLYGGGSGSGLAQWTTLTLSRDGFSLRYDLLLRPRPADRFSVGYNLHLP